MSHKLSTAAILGTALRLFGWGVCALCLLIALWFFLSGIVEMETAIQESVAMGASVAMSVGGYVFARMVSEVLRVMKL